MAPATRKFVLNERVKLPKNESRDPVIKDGYFEIIRLMPEDQQGEFHYRLKSASGERVARECEMEAVDGPASPHTKTTQS